MDWNYEQCIEREIESKDTQEIKREWKFRQL